MKKWVCSVCGYVYEGENPPEKCPQCGVPASKFTEQKGELSWAAGGQSPRKPLCAPRGPRIGCKSPEVNSADFKILPPAKYLYAGLPAERRGLPLPYFSSAAWSAFASAMAFSWAAGGQSS